MRARRVAVIVTWLIVGTVLSFRPAAAQTANKQINVTGTGPGDYAFSPAGGSIASGQTVLWENHTDAPHTATADSGEFNVSIPSGSGNRSSAVTISGSPRTISYHCSIHSTMKGTLQVTPGMATTSPPTTSAPAATPTTARGATATTAKTGATATTSARATSTSNNFDALTTTSEEPTTSTTAGQVAIKQSKKGGGGNPLAIGALGVGIAAVLAGGAYGMYRLGGRATQPTAKKR
jgi:plastocyanin